MPTASTAILEALAETGVRYLFANFGSDHPGIVEAIAEARTTGRVIPEIVTSPNEMVALSAAQGYAQASGQAQAVLVHVDCGTQALGGAVHNAARNRAPVLILAGLSPATQAGELKGSRNEFIQWIQDVPDQPGIVRNYVKYENEIRYGRNARQIIHRAMQIATSDPKGPVYLTVAREVLEQEVPPTPARDGAGLLWPALGAAALADADIARLADALGTARRPLVVTSYLGRDLTAVGELVRLVHTLGLGVLESAPSAVNFPTGDPLYQGNQWNQPRQNEALAAADLVLVLDSDIPWIPTVNRPAAEAAIYHIDVDPLKERLPLWYIDTRRSWRADTATVLRQLNDHVARQKLDLALSGQRAAHWHAMAAARRERLARLEAMPEGAEITPEYLAACVRRHINDDTIVLNEGISNYHTVINHLGLTHPGSMLTSGGSSLGWHGGAAIGVKLAQPERTVVAMAGDGSYMFSVPSSVHWMARQYRTPFLTVIFNNRGWKSPKLSALALHPDGYASRANALDVEFDPPPDYAAIAGAAGGAYARTLRRPDEVEAAVAEAFAVVRNERRAAVLDVWVPHL